MRDRSPCAGLYLLAVFVRINNFANIPVGNINFAAPNYSTNKNWVINIDYNQSDKTQHRGRYINNDYAAIDIGDVSSGVLCADAG